MSTIKGNRQGLEILNGSGCAVVDALARLENRRSVWLGVEMAANGICFQPRIRKQRGHIIPEKIPNSGPTGE